MNQVLIPKNTNTNTQLSVDIDTEQLKYFFYMMQGEPASRTKVLGGAILVTKADLERLIGALIDQLKLAHVRDYTIRVGVGFEKEVVEKNFDEFKEYTWSEPKRTEEITIRLNFMYEDYQSGNPLKHALFVRIAREINPGNFFQILASSDNEKLDAFETLTSPVFCRTDHVNDDLSKALINAVSDWHKGQKQPQLLSKSYEFAKRHKERLARIVHYSFPFVSALLMCLATVKVVELYPTSSYLPSIFASIVVASVFFNTFFTGYGNRRASKIFNHLAKMSDQDVIFEITQGDSKDYAERINKNNKAFRSAKGVFLWAMFQNILAGLIGSALFEYLK